MPWTAADAGKHTKRAGTPGRAHLWARVANRVLERTGDEALAIREADAVVGRADEANFPFWLPAEKESGE